MRHGPLIDATETKDQLTVSLRQRQSRYFDEFIDLACAEDMLALRLFPNAKEITESFAAYHAVRSKMRLLWSGEPGQSRVREYALSDRRVALVAVGDGRTPRTAATFAFRSAWACWSVDPQVKPHGWGRIERLTVVPQPIEAFRLDHDGPVVIVAVHSHAPLDAVLDRVTGTERVIVAIPCCVPQVLNRPPDLEYQDWAIWSPHRLVRLWKT